MIFVLPEDIQYPRLVRLYKLTSREICLYLYGVTIHFSVNNFDSNLPKFASQSKKEKFRKNYEPLPQKKKEKGKMQKWGT
jgi:hypothetical protein